MTTTTDAGNGVALRPSIPARLGQATAVEQSRAVAEVEAAVVVAQRIPRNVQNAIAEMRESCRRKELADRAFYRYPKGGQMVSGPTVALARELARIWGNIQWGLREMRRDSDASEMLAFAWDVQTNARCDNIIINPHKLYTGGKDLSELRDINDNNTNVGSRRVREAIFSVLPSWFVEEAKDLCAKTISDGGGVPLATRVANAIEVFGNLGITVPQLETKIGAKPDKWTDHDVAQLRIIRQSLLRGEVSKDEEFPPAAARVTADDIKGQPAGKEPAAGPEPSRDRYVKGATAKLERLLGSLQLGTDKDVKALLEWQCGGQYTATRSQLQLVTGYLEDHIKAAGGELPEAASNIWTQYRAVHAQDAAAEAGQDGGSDGD